jgi:hypothetical protein
MTLQDIKTRWIRARIAYHRRKAVSYNKPVETRSFKRDSYQMWMRTMALRHSMKAAALERGILPDVT